MLKYHQFLTKAMLSTGRGCTPAFARWGRFFGEMMTSTEAVTATSGFWHRSRKLMHPRGRGSQLEVEAVLSGRPLSFQKLWGRQEPRGWAPYRGALAPQTRSLDGPVLVVVIHGDGLAGARHPRPVHRRCEDAVSVHVWACIWATLAVKVSTGCI